MALAESKSQHLTIHFSATRTKRTTPRIAKTSLTMTARSYSPAIAWLSRVSRCRQQRYRRIAHQSYSRRSRLHMRFKIRIAPAQLVVILFSKLIRPSLRSLRVKGTHKLFSQAMCQQLRWIVKLNTTIGLKFNSSTACSLSRAGKRNASKTRRRNLC